MMPEKSSNATYMFDVLVIAALAGGCALAGLLLWILVGILRSETGTFTMYEQNGTLLTFEIVLIILIAVLFLMLAVFAFKRLIKKSANHVVRRIPKQPTAIKPSAR